MNIRSITRDEIDKFADVVEKSGEFKDTLTSLWESGESSPEWCFVAEERGAFIARVSYWVFLSNPGEIHMLGLHLPWEGDYCEIGAKLLAQSLSQMHSRGAVSLECRLYSDSTTFLKEHRKLFELVDLSLTQEKWRFIWEETDRSIIISDRLVFKTLKDAGKDTFINAIQQVTEGTLDRDDQLSIEASGAEKTALNYFNTLKDVDYRPEWWQLAYKTDGRLAGLVIPQKFSPEEGAINYIGVVPEQRGLGYVNDLLAKGTIILQSNGIKRIIADTDSNNIPMANANIRAGYKRDITTWCYRLELQRFKNTQ
ncbi:GNAT family N-acetyltransferase [candidate division WOR-3 bacterium]|nr:GNAT family N-acetyltransferase [candidate division WOR-3 bacterium]